MTPRKLGRRSDSIRKPTTPSPPPQQQDSDPARPAPPSPTASRWRTSLASRLPPGFDRIVKALSMQRYTVTVVAPGTTDAQPVLLVPFKPDALVTAFIDELYRRIAKQSLAITPNTHIATLHLDSETGALIDAEDLLSDVISDPKAEKLFSVFTKKETGSAAPNGQVQESLLPTQPTNEGPLLPVRVLTASSAKDKQTCPVLRVPFRSTIKQLHERVAEQLQIAANFDQNADSNECNCKWANQLSTIALPENTMLVVSGKSNLERLDISSHTEASVKAALRQRFGQDYELTKRLALVGSDVDIHNPSIYKRVPVAAICSRQRHTPVHARVDIDETGHRRSKVLDLHTSEIPISLACMDATLEEVGLSGLIRDGAIDIFAVSRTTTGQNAQAIGKSSVFRARAHWEPRVTQSDRGMAMFLSSLRVFASLVQDMSDDERSQDAVLHAFDLLTTFPPAVRTLHILIQGKTPTAVESAALSAGIFEVLDSFAPEDIIGSDKSRVFELSRLFLGFVLEKARTLKLGEDGGAPLPYLSSLESVDLTDHRTGEAVTKAVNTSQGLVEVAIFESFQDGGLLAGTHLQSHMVRVELSANVARLALLSGGAVTNITAFAAIANYRYADSGDVNAAIDLGELSELNHLAELCGRNKLAVHKPSQLSSAVTPCLTFDRNAHLAVYTGEQPCGDPGHSSILFRPQSGEETIDSAVIEQLIAPLLQAYEADGTAVFDALGGAAVRRLQAPDEILMFCVDCSASMRQPTDFDEVNDAVPFTSDEPDIQSYVEADFYNRASFDDMKDNLNQYPGMGDMIAIIADAEEWERRRTVDEVLEVLRGMLSSEIIKKAENLANRRGGGRLYGRQQINALETDLNKIKTFWAGLKTHEGPVRDFLMYRATSQSRDITQRWTWSLGDAVPASRPIQQIPSLPSDITDLPDNLRCPISHTLMEEAATATDGHTYAASAIRQWFNIRNSSPMTGLELQDTSLNPNTTVSEAAANWAAGDGILGREQNQQSSKRPRYDDLEVTFDSRLGSFSRRIPSHLTLKQLYILAFRGLKGRALVFQLTHDRYGPLTPTPEAAVSSRDIKNGDHINIRIAEDDPTGVAPANAPRAHDQVLVKVYTNADNMLFGFWVKRETTQTMTSVLWKYWRYRFRHSNHVDTGEKQVWVDMENSGDGLMRGNPLANTEMLATYLNRAHCFGHLGEEKVYKDDGSARLTDTSNQPLVLKVKIIPPWKPNRERNRLTRLDVLKQMFEAAINRMLAYNYKTHCGLVTFASTPKVAMNISHVLENFRKSTQNMQAEGDTALWDALALGKDQLVEYSKKYPEAKKRIICISDGEDTKSTTNKPDEICWRLRQAGIAVDTISLGDEDNADLRTISHLLGCYSLHPTSLMNALATTEMEPFLSLTERPAIKPPPNAPRHRLQFMGYFWSAKWSARFTLVTADEVPPRKEHPNLEDDFVQVNAMAARPINRNNAGSSRSNLRTSRLMTEMRAIAASGSHPKYDVYVSESDMSFWKVVMGGPDESPYSAGTFMLYVHADEGYPTFAPKARFITKIKHPNVNQHGRICHSILTRDWTSDISMTTLLDSVFGLLLQPEHSDPVNTITTLGFHHDQVEFADEVRDHVRRHARKNRAQWKRELLGEESLDEDDDVNEEDEEMDGDGW